MENNNNIWGKQVIEKALEYANYKWTASEANVLHEIDSEKSEVIIIDATRSTGKVSVRTENVAQLFEKGYQIYRKK